MGAGAPILKFLILLQTDPCQLHKAGRPNLPEVLQKQFLVQHRYLRRLLLDHIHIHIKCKRNFSFYSLLYSCYY